MDIFKVQAKKNESGTDTQRVLMEAFQAQRVIADKTEQNTGVKSEYMTMENDDLKTTKELEVYYPSKDATTNNGAPASISKDKSNPAINTISLRRQKLLSVMNVSCSCPTAEN